jgi:hypothetical protein
VLKLLARRKIILARRCWWLVSDAMPSAKCRQRGIRQLRAASQQFFMDSHEIPLAPVEKLQNLLPVRFGFLRALQLWHGG